MSSLNEGIRIPQHMLREIKLREPPRQWECDESVFLNSDANQVQTGRVAGKTSGTGLGLEGNEMAGEIAALILQKADSKEGFDRFADAIVDRMQNLVVHHQGPSSDSADSNLWAPHCRATTVPVLDPAHASSCRDYLSKVLEDLNKYDDKQTTNDAPPSHSFSAMPMIIQKLGISVPRVQENEKNDTIIPVGATRKPAQPNHRDGSRLVQGHAIHSSTHDQPSSTMPYDTPSSEEAAILYAYDAAGDGGGSARSSSLSHKNDRPATHTHGKGSRAGEAAPEQRKAIRSNPEEHHEAIGEAMISRPVVHPDRQVAPGPHSATLASNMYDASSGAGNDSQRRHQVFSSADSEGISSTMVAGSARCSVHVEQGVTYEGRDTPPQPADKTDGPMTSEPAFHSVPIVQGSKLNPSNTTLVERGPASQHGLVRRAQLPTEHAHESATHSETMCTTLQHAAPVAKNLESEDTEQQLQQRPSLGGVRVDTSQVVRQEPRRPGPALTNFSQVNSSSKNKQQKKRGKEPPVDLHVSSNEVKGVIVNQEAVARKGHLLETAAAMTKICKKLAAK
jgi:hypothetical protein